MSQLQTKKPYRLDPCPAEERVEDLYDVPDQYEVQTRGGADRESVEESGVSRQKCGGGHRILRKKIGNS